MFYEKQSKEQQKAYKNMLTIIGRLSNLFSDNQSPMLYYRAHENCFCKYFDTENLSRHDCSADASKEGIGIGLKTWVGSNNQKIAEFGRLRNELNNLSTDDLINKVSQYRNSRIKTTMNMYKLSTMIYHIIVRSNNKMSIKECSFDFIDIANVKRLPERDGNNTIYFTDNKRIYNFNKAKTTLYMHFDNLEHLDDIPVKIMNDPFSYLEETHLDSEEILHLLYKPKNRLLALKLYTETNAGCTVNEKSGLNIWNAAGRKRHPDEVYICFNKFDKTRPQNIGFFPPDKVVFDIQLPDGSHISAKNCQDGGKAIMSNPNRALGKWLLRDVLELPERTLITYQLLQEKGFDTVLFEKIDDLHYKINFTNSSVYTELYKTNASVQ